MQGELESSLPTGGQRPEIAGYEHWVKGSHTLNDSDSIEPRPRIVFLGSDLNPISVRCLECLVAAGTYEILVGVDGGHGGSSIAILQHVWKRHGAKGVLRRLVTKYRATTRLKGPAKRMRGDCLSLRELMMVHQLEGFHAARINSRESVMRVKRFRPDLIVVANFSQVIRSPLLSIAPRGVINFHPSLLPKYRGPMPFYWVLKNGESRTGVTVHYIDEQVDTGDIILQAEVDVKANDTETSLRQRSIEVGAPLLVKAVEAVFDGSATATPQDETEMSYYGFPPRGASKL